MVTLATQFGRGYSQSCSSNYNNISLVPHDNDNDDVDDDDGCLVGAEF